MNRRPRQHRPQTLAAASRLAGCLALLAAVCGPPGPSAFGADAPSLKESFQDAPAEALIRRLQPGPGRAASQPGVVLAAKHRRLADLRAVRIDAALRNTTKSAVRCGEVTVADWAFRVQDAADAAPRYQLLTYRRDTWYGSTYWTGPDWTRVGKDWHHPGIHTPSVRRFTAPRDGRVTITGRVYKADLNGDGVRASIRHGRRTVWTADIKGKDARGAECKLALTVRKGDAVRFVVHKLGRIFYDTTRWDPVVTYSDGTRCQASRGFSTRRQGEGGWSYEMELGEPPDRPRPHVYAVTGDLALRDAAVGAPRPVELTSREASGLLAVSDARGRSRIALAVGGARPWRLRCGIDGGLLRVSLAVGGEEAPLSLKPGESVRLPPIILGACRGDWHAGLATLRRILDRHAGELGMEPLKARLAETACDDLALAAMVHAEWRREDKLTGTGAPYAAATREHLAKARLLLADLRRDRPAAFLADHARRLERLAAEARRPDLDAEARRSVYRRVRWLKRRIALANPLMRFGKLLFCKRVPTSYSHLVMQYFGWRARAGGGLFVLERPGVSLQCRDLTAGRLDDGCVLEPCLSYDARRVVFSYVECRGKSYRPGEVANGGGGYYHIWQVNADPSAALGTGGSGLRQLTDGPYDDLMPAYLPDGGIVFSSTRRRGYARCFGGQFSRRWHVYTLHRMDADGGNVRMLSCHDTNEWFPSVMHDGRILYARWDYVDRDAVTHQNLWSMRPDGANPATVWGNATASPHCSFQAKAIPRSGKFVFTASAHHSITAGSIALADPSVHYDGHDAITRITPEVPFPEAESRNIREYYAAPWPLSETYFLVAYSPVPLRWEPRANPPNALGIYLLDRFGNRELIYRDPRIGCTNPIPLAPRPAPPVLPSALRANAPPTGEMLLIDVYQGLGETPRGRIKELRILQVFPKTTPRANEPRIGVAGEENGRAILGCVPVEPDGSARFTLPARTPVLFQALDADGFAYQTMRSLTYVQPGERISCVGCHESRMTAPAPVEVMARRRPASTITRGPRDGRPFSYAETVQPVLDRHCIQCHSGKAPKAGLDLTGSPQGAWTRSYVSLTRDARRIPRYAARNRIQLSPVGGARGALGSGLIRMLRKGHNKVRLSPEDMRRLAAWIDCNAIFYGSPDPAHHARQRRGEPVPMPEIQ